jgi:chromosome segregation ATPase
MKELSQINIDKPEDDTKASNNKSKEDKLLIEKLNKEIAVKNNEIIQLQNKLLDSQEKIHDIIIEKGSLKKTINEFELKELDIRFGKFEELKNDYNKLEHRLNVTKEQLDEIRSQIKFHKKVIDDLEKRGFMDYIRKRYPESFINYKKK